MSSPPAPVFGAGRDGRSWARFDDLTNGRALVFEPARAVVSAWTPQEVPAALARVEAACAAGGWAAGFVTYEAAAGLAGGLPVGPGQEGLPLLWFGLVDHPPREEPSIEASAGDGHATGTWQCDWEAPEHAAAVRSVHDRIAAGDTYQVNLTTRMRAQSSGDPLSLYADMAHAQQGAYNAYLDIGDHAIVSASPELFFAQHGDRVVMRPMKGTAARGPTTALDREVRDTLLSSTKERAENVMIVDLVRNDLARVAEVGGVHVTRLLSAERYPTVQQLTSQVEAVLRPGVSLVELFSALFPCGSVTGAPKIASMQLIRELETSARGVYCGAIGMVGPPGAAVRARFSVAIRTAVVQRQGEHAVYGSGGGITWDSRPDAEFTELLDKARVLQVPTTEFELWETMRHEEGLGLRAWPQHLARLVDSAQYFGFRLRLHAVRAALDHALAGLGDGRVRLRCSRDGEFQIDVTALPAPRDVVRLALDADPVDESASWVHHKTSLRKPYDERLARHPAADDVVIVNSRGELTESCRASLAVRLGGVWWTPPLSSGCLPGIARAESLRSGRLRERVLRPADLARAEELAVLNSLRGWEPAVMSAEKTDPWSCGAPVRTDRGRES